MIVIMAVSFIVVFGTAVLAEKHPESKKERGIKSLIYGLENGNKGLKVSCALIIGEYGFEEALDVLAAILKSGEDTDVKYAAMVALYKMKTKAAVMYLNP
jgi:HEAT repeat protein